MGSEFDRELRDAAEVDVESALGVETEEDDEGGPLGLFVLTAFLGLLVFLDAFVTKGQPLWGLPWRPAAIAAVVGGTRVTFASLSGALVGDIGADLALAIATWAAFAIGEPLAAAEVVFIAMTGESLEEIAYARTAKALERLLSLWPKTATVLVDGREVTVPSHEVEVGATVVVRPGERLPVDGTILEGVTSLDESTLTGESVPADRGVGDEVFSGTQNLLGSILVTAEKVGGETTLGQVVRLVKQAQEEQAPVQRLADLYASYFLPVVLACAALTFLISRDYYRTVAVLVIACPCALVLATPAAVLAGIGRLARQGVLVKSGEALELMARVKTLAFDKTGTLTEAKLELGELVAFGCEDDQLLRLAAAAEAGSEHPLARAIVAAAEQAGLSFQRPETFEARPGAGLVATGPDGRLAVGNARLMEQLVIDVPHVATDAAARLAEDGQTTIFVARDGELLGVIGARDRLRADAVPSVAELHSLGMTRVALLTGDRDAVAQAVAREVGIDEVLAEQLPTDKAAWIRTRRNAGERVAMIGDGINDAPALAAADVGVAVADTGADIAAEAADVVLLGDPLAQVPELVRISRRTLGTIKLSIIGFAFGLNSFAVLLSAFGKLTPVQAAIFHQVGSLAVLLNSLRLLGFEPRPETLQARILARVKGVLEAILGLDIDGFVGWIAERWRLLLRLVATAVAALWALSCFVPVAVDQVAVIRVLGRHAGTYGPGIAVKPWWPVGRAKLVRPDQVRYLELGFRRTDPKKRQVALNPQYDWDSAHLSGEYERITDEAAMLTGDLNFVEAQAVVQYTVSSPSRFVFAARDPEQLLRFHAEEALRRVVSETDLDTVLTVGRHPIEESAVARLQQACDDSGMGVRIDSFELADVHPPLEVVPSFRAVASAFENQLQRINEAEAYANEQVALAGGEAAAEVTTAEAYQAARVARSRGDAKRFTDRQRAAATGRKVTFDRLYLEAVERVLVGRKKMILDPKATGRRQMWTLDPTLAKVLEALGAQPYAVPSPFGSEAETQQGIEPGATPPDNTAAPANPAAQPAPPNDPAAANNPANAAAAPADGTTPTTTPATPDTTPPSLPGLAPSSGTGGGQ